MSDSVGTRGAVTVEYLIAFMPVMLLFAATWQFADVAAAQLIVERAASAAVRAAVVVLPDDPVYYGGERKDAYEGERQRLVELAAALVLQASPKILSNPQVRLSGNLRDDEIIRVEVKARYRCLPGWGVLVCGLDRRLSLSANGRLPYHGAPYSYPR